MSLGGGVQTQVVCQKFWNLFCCQEFWNLLYKGFHHLRVHVAINQELFRWNLHLGCVHIQVVKTFVKKGSKTLDNRKGSKTFNKPPESADHHPWTLNDYFTFF